VSNDNLLHFKRSKKQKEQKRRAEKRIVRRSLQDFSVILWDSTGFLKGVWKCATEKQLLWKLGFCWTVSGFFFFYLNEASGILWRLITCNWRRGRRIERGWLFTTLWNFVRFFLEFALMKDSSESGECGRGRKGAIRRRWRGILQNFVGVLSDCFAFFSGEDKR